MKQSHHHFFSKKQRLHFFLGKKTKQKSQEPKYTASPLSIFLILLLSELKIWFTAFSHARILARASAQ
jgi:hypothetical protein